MKKPGYMILSGLIICGMLAACGKAGSQASSDEGTKTETTAGNEAVQDQAEERPAENTAQEASEETSEPVPEEKRSLAKRMAGKYSFDVAQGDLGEEECFTLNVITFGDNLYAFCGQAMNDGDYPDVYSYWASEFVPYDAGDMKSTVSDSVKVNELCFSNMSNAGKYWDSGREGTITLTPEGLLFDGFANDGFLSDGAGGGRLFVKDDRVEDVFPYITDDSKGGDATLQGVWVTEIDGTDVYLEFRGRDLTVFRKSPSEEVKLLRFGCDFADGTFTGRGNVLGNGGMPSEISAEYRTEGDHLVLHINGDALPVELSGVVACTRTEEEAIPVITMDDIEFHEDSFGLYGSMQDTTPIEFGEYYGVFIASYKTSEECADTVLKLEEAGYRYCPTVYTPDFSLLNPAPYYSVTAGLFTKEQTANEVLEDIKAKGFKDAYVKKAGSYIGDRNWYALYGGESIEVLQDHIILHDVSVTIPYMTDDDPVKTDLYLYEDAVFDRSADRKSFGNYEEGDTPFRWFKKNYDLRSSDPDAYMAEGPALLGIFEIGLDGNRIRAYYGSYWWD